MSDRVIEALMREEQPVDMPRFVAKWGNEALEAALLLVLRNPSQHELHIHALAGLRILAERSKLTTEGARALLEHTRDVAREAGQEEWYKTLDVLALSRESASLLLPFAERLLKHHDIRDWRWLAFLAVAGAVAQGLHPSSPLRGILRDEAGTEADERRRAEMVDVLNRLPT